MEELVSAQLSLFSLSLFLSLFLSPPPPPLFLSPPFSLLPRLQDIVLMLLPPSLPQEGGCRKEVKEGRKEGRKKAGRK
jgi:hypothetical protein